MNLKLIAATITAAGLLAVSALSNATPTNPLSPSYQKSAVTIAEYHSPNTTRYVDAANPLNSRYSRDGDAGRWVATAITTERLYRDVANPLHPSFKRI